MNEEDNNINKSEDNKKVINKNNFDDNNSFSNTHITYKILTILILVLSVERSFSKLKLIKSHLKSTIPQQKLN